MGYNTRYSLTFRDETPDPIECLLGNSAEAGFCINDTGGSEEPGKWSEYEAEMVVLSIRFPHYVFTLHGEGEEPGDIWDKHFKNGKMQVCKAEVACPPFDESKLE